MKHFIYSCTAEPSLAQHLKDCRFLVAIVFQQDILHDVDTVSKVWQNTNIGIQVAFEAMENTGQWLRICGVEGGVVSAGEESEVEGEPLLNKDRVVRRKNNFGYESAAELKGDTKEDSEFNFFYFVVDVVTVRFEERSQQVTEHHRMFGFLSCPSRWRKS